MTRLRPAYAKDVLSFLSCESARESLSERDHRQPSRLAAGSTPSVEIVVGSAEDFGSPRVNPDGYAERGSRRHKSWPKVQAEWGCCREELEELAATLVSERIFPAYPDESLVKIWVRNDGEVSPSYRATFLWARNAMTAETASGLLHLLDHLRGVHVELLNILLSNDAVAEHSTLNPAIVPLLSGGSEPYRLHVGDLELLSAAQDANKLIAGLHLFKVRHLHMCGEDAVDDVAAFEVAMQAKRLCESMVYHASIENASDAALEHFQRAVPRIGRDVVSKLSLFDDPASWPAGLPPKEEMQVELMSTDNGNRTVSYRLPGGMTNAHSGEHFDVEFRCHYNAEEVVVLCEMSLLFR